MKRKMTLKNIARELGVSISTVSKALKNSNEIGAETIERVQAFAKLYNYRPNNLAISLKNKRTNNIGVIIPDIVHYFFTTVFRGIEQYSKKHGYNVIACVTDESLEREVVNMEMLANGSVDGFIMALSAETQKKNHFDHLKRINELEIPLVLFDRVTDEIECDKVLINDREAAYNAVMKFIENGRRKIALITTEDYFSVSQGREAGYRQALESFGLPVDEALILKLPFMDLDEILINTFFDSQDIDAVLCVNEIFAIHSMNLVQKKGVNVPEEMEFIGFTDGILSKYAKPGLTSMAQHGFQMGEIAAKMLIDRIQSGLSEKEEPCRTEIIESTLIERESTINAIPVL
ncbi:LacI family DNA-binding transcriptional regulator [Maribacter sp. ANRC-HE7]|uniref:LacI family DNA-binding transcriptional regulator n=1 Tax=Maribacter aquimaris TaxID=2737171 RepID=A0ABR7UY19_9FLAO|nr:LacI family DNA-binding transcriptional regulator [Maribacter aquimaris]MBD0777127.1 LacI family DNA-binding transcriptional regulator [Maribacter aquimaris]